jgi:hypothetical protein
MCLLSHLDCVKITLVHNMWIMDEDHSGDNDGIVAEDNEGDNGPDNDW